MTDQEPDTQPIEVPIEPLYTHPASPFLRTEASAIAHVEMPALPQVPSTWSAYRAQIEFGLAMVAYLMVLVGSVTVLQANPGAPWRYVVSVLPVVPAALTLTIFVRALSRLDELQKRIQMQAFGFSLGATALLPASTPAGIATRHSAAPAPSIIGRLLIARSFRSLVISVPPCSLFG